MITTTVEPVGNVVGSKALCVQCLLCCALCYSSARRLIKCRGQQAVLSLMDAIIEKKVLIPMEDVKVSTQNTAAV